MAERFTNARRERCRAYLKMHLSKDELKLPAKEQISIIEKKNKKRWWYMGLNVVFILLFGYSFWSGLTRLSHTVFYVLVVVFFINIALFFYQKKQMSELVAYLNWKKDK